MESWGLFIEIMVVSTRFFFYNVLLQAFLKILSDYMIIFSTDEEIQLKLVAQGHLARKW